MMTAGSRATALCVAAAAVWTASSARAQTWYRPDDGTVRYYGFTSVANTADQYGNEFIDVYGSQGGPTYSVVMSELLVNYVSAYDGVPVVTWNLGGATYGIPSGLRLWNPSANIWHQEVFVLGTDNNLYHQWNDVYGWSGWYSLGAPPGVSLCSSPSAVSWTGAFGVRPRCH
jgi:hypothetical protein